MEFVMAVVALIGVGAVGLLCMLMGLLAREMAEESGKIAVFLAGSVAGAFCAALFGFMAYMVADISQWPITTTVTTVSIVGFLITMIPPLHLIWTGSEQARRMLEMAPEVKRAGLKLFASADSNEDRLLEINELSSAAANARREDSEILEYMAAMISYIGHVIDSYTTTDTVFVPMTIGNTTTMIPQTQTTTHYVYGINEKDLETYEDRLRVRFRNWL